MLKNILKFQDFFLQNFSTKYWKNFCKFLQNIFRVLRKGGLPMPFIPYEINERIENTYYQLPMELFENPLYKDKLSSDSKILYAFLLNRLQLSAKNNWNDDDGNLYLIFTRKQVQERLNLCDKTVTKAFKQLSECNLISEKKQGATKPNLIYVGKIEHANKIVNRKNYDSVVVKNTVHELKNLRPIYINNSYN